MPTNDPGNAKKRGGNDPFEGLHEIMNQEINRGGGSFLDEEEDEGDGFESTGLVVAS